MPSPLRVGIFYFSQSGNTRLVAETLYEEFKSHGITAGCKSFTYPEERENLPPFSEILDAYDVFLIGTPIHYLNPIPLVHDFIKELARATENRDMRASRKFGGVFCTYGGFRYANSLRNLGKDLVAAKISLMGGLAIAAPENFPGIDVPEEELPIPGEEARDLIRQFVITFLSKIQDIQAEEAAGNFYKSRDFLPKLAEGGLFNFIGGLVMGSTLARDQLPPVFINHERCQRCMKCITACPTGNIGPDPHLIQVGSDCIKCYQCVRACPYDALFTNIEFMTLILRQFPRKSRTQLYQAFL